MPSEKKFESERKSRRDARVGVLSVADWRIALQIFLAL